MLFKSEGIVLQNIKYADKKSILKIFTLQHGLTTFFAATGKSPNSKIKNASILPLYQVELSYIFKQNRDVQKLTESSILYIYEGISRDYYKLAIAQFLNEILVKTIKEQLPNEELYHFVTQSYKWLNEATEGVNNFHIFFLLELSKYLGFEPNNNYKKDCCYFDVREGKFTPVALSFPTELTLEQSKLFSEILSKNVLEISFNRRERNDVLECLLALYKFHVAGFNELKSFEVLKQLFN